jgi:hypothetical protein
MPQFVYVHTRQGSYSPECVEVEFSELRLNGVLRSPSRGCQQTWPGTAAAYGRSVGVANDPNDPNPHAWPDVPLPCGAAGEKI